MSNLQFNLGRSDAAAKPAGILGMIFLFLFGLPFLGFGLFALKESVSKFAAGNSKDALGIGLFGLVFFSFGLGVMFFGFWARRKSRQQEELKARHPGQPWLLRPDWAAGRIKSSANAQTVLSAIMAVAFLAIGGTATAVALPQELPKGNHLVLLVLLFPLVGVAFLAAFIRGVLARRWFGDCFFELASIPGVIGGTLEGMIQTGSLLRLEHGLTLKLSCIRRTVSGFGKNRSTHESILWQDEKVFNPAGGLPEPEPGRSGIPVYFKIPADQPACFSQGNETVYWRLETSAKMQGPDFTASFDVPVYRVAGAAVSVEETDPTASLQVTVEELRREENSPIQVTDGPNGREFYFPAARNPGPALVFTIFGLGAAVGCVALVVKHVSYFAAAIVGLFAALFGMLGINLLLKSSRVTVNASGITLQNCWLVFARTRRFEASEITRFDTAVGMTSGTKAFHDVKLITHEFEQNSFEANKRRYQQTGEVPRLKNLRIRDGRGITLGSAVASTTEAKWLVREMTKSLGRTV
jgi:hypothetical protein